jgi:dihydrofolate synthase/folylpolyglutamate synthase
VARSLAEWLALQEAAHPKSIDLGLERVAAVARRLGLERPSSAVITVGGTNGKGSTAAHLEALLLAAGRSVGLFTSPHFLRYNERIRIDGAEARDADLIEAFERIEAARGATTLTFFEYNTLAALYLFARREVEFALLEVGLGGRLDATNLIDADVSVLCSVGLDHRDWLGETLEEIGAEKAGIFRARRPAVLGTAHMPDSVYAAIGRLGARPIVAERDFSWRARPGAVGEGSWSYRGLRLHLADLPPSALAGSIQYRNAATALAALEALALDGARSGSAEAVLAALDARTVAAALRRPLSDRARPHRVDPRHRAQSAGGRGVGLAAEGAALSGKHLGGGGHSRRQGCAGHRGGARARGAALVPLRSARSPRHRRRGARAASARGGARTRSRRLRG